MQSIGPGEPTPSIASSRPSPEASRPFVFAATGSAYFRIWIVNLLLTVITVGIYSPWAKVRRLRYFYGNTLFDGSPFEFHGRPIALLKGRLIGLVLLVAYSQAERVSLTLWFGVVAILFALLPWLMWKSFRFRFANSSYRGIHFAFDGSVGEAYVTFVPLMLMVLGPAIVLVIAQSTAGPVPDLRTLGKYYVALAVVLVFAPWFYFRLRAYQHRRARLGSTPFAFDGRVRTAYAIAGKFIVFSIGFGFLGGLVGALAGGIAWMAVHQVAPRFATTWGPTVVGFAVFYLVIISSLSFNKAMVQNFVWNHSLLADSRFASDVGRRRLWWIELVNLVFTLATLGMFWPFAVVRSMRYRIESLSWAGDSDALVVSASGVNVGATGEETAELFGLDIAL
jgi:uncharacterized membrane protein YjgN (DUF898 family)